MIQFDIRIFLSSLKVDLLGLVLVMAEIRRSPVEVGSFIILFSVFVKLHPRWLAEFLNHQQYEVEVTILFVSVFLILS